MIPLQLRAFFALTQEQRNALAEIVLLDSKHKIATLIQKIWRRSWLYRNNLIQTLAKNSFQMTCICCINFLRKNLDHNVAKTINFLHGFFESHPQYQIPKEKLQVIFDGIFKTVGNDTHLFFCTLNNLLSAPENIVFTEEQFTTLFSIFPIHILNDLVKYFNIL